MKKIGIVEEVKEPEARLPKNGFMEYAAVEALAILLANENWLIDIVCDPGVKKITVRADLSKAKAGWSDQIPKTFRGYEVEGVGVGKLVESEPLKKSPPKKTRKKKNGNGK